LIEPDARFMPKSDGPSYNAQAAVDSKTHLILSNDVSDAPNDQNQFEIMHQRTECTLSEDPERQYTVDSGFHSLKQLEYIENKQIDALVADPTPENRSIHPTPTAIEPILREARRVKRSDFAYHIEEDCYKCPNGDKLLPLKKLKKQRYTIYQAHNCGSCPLVKLCVSNRAKVKRIHRDSLEGLAEQMSLKMQTDSARIRMKVRATTVEPVFGNLKQNLGFRRFHLRGLEKVKGEFNLICIGHNLNVLFKLMYKNHVAPVFCFLSSKRNCNFTFLRRLIDTLMHWMIEILKIPSVRRNHSTAEQFA